MLSKKENIKAGLGVSHNAVGARRFDHSPLRQLVRDLSELVNKRVSFKELLEQVSVPASLLFFLTVPVLLVCVSIANFVVLWLAIPFIVVGVVGGVLLYRHRSKKRNCWLI